MTDDPESTESGEAPDSDSFEQLLKRAAHVTGPTLASLGLALHPGSTLLDGRLKVLRCIGEGGMGVVYAVLDEQRRSTVALKTLNRLDAGNVYRLKNEFRSLADVSHPNLCRLHELFGEHGQWFFTMELLEDAVHFGRYVRPDGQLDESRLRALLPQLLDGIEAIHGAGKLHRDLKPSNVLITSEGRAVILDFGLAMDSELGGPGHGVHDTGVSGTPGYMAPEQAADQPATMASDCYALGAMLFEALTGKLPFEGNAHEMRIDKQRNDAPRAASVAPNVPADLDALCAALLSRTAASRPDATQARATLARAQSNVAGPRPAASTPAVETLIGRDAELAQLRAAYQASVAGRAVVTYVGGESGIGKSALVMAFLDELRARGDTVVIAGRCYERENVPFKGFDSIVDDLSRHLRKLPDGQVSALMPREVYALARVFPVLDRVDAVARGTQKHIPDPQDLKRRAFDAFCELLARIRYREPFVLFIDDLQWIDQDSVRLMRALFVQADPPPVLLIVAHRSEGSEGNLLLQATLQSARDNPAFDTRVITVGPLQEPALTALARRWMPDLRDPGDASAFARETQGNPFFALELARAQRDGARAALPTLADALASHAARLPPPAQALLSVLALAGQPIAPQIAVEAVGLSDGHAQLDTLRAEQLVRVSLDREGERRLECYHDKIREHFAGALNGQRAGELARGLSRALLADSDADAELLVRCLDLADLSGDAAAHAARAGAIAFTALAFERAAAHYTYALDHGRFEPARVRELRILQADAIAAAGYGERAGQIYARAADDADGEHAIDLTRKAAEQYLLCGNLERGRALLARALRRERVRFPTTLPGALASVAWWRGRLTMRGLSFTPRDMHSSDTLRELGALRLATNCLVRTDQLRAADFCARWVVCALDAGHRVELARALGWEIFFVSMIGVPHSRVEAVIALCAQLCEETHDPLATYWLHYCRGIHRLIRCAETASALEDFERAIQLMTEHPSTTSSYDRAWVQGFRAMALMMMGRLDQSLELAQAQIEDALARGDYTASAALAPTVCVSLLGADRPEQSRRVCAEAHGRLRADEVTYQDFSLVALQPMIDIYSGRDRDAWHANVERFERIAASFQGRVLAPGSIESFSCGVAAAARRADPSAHGQRTFAKRAERLAKRAALNDMGLMPMIPQAVLACVRGDRPAAVAKLRAYGLTTRSPLNAHVVQRRLGELLGDDEGQALIAEADAFLRAGGVVDPARFVHSFMPGIEIP